MRAMRREGEANGGAFMNGAGEGRSVALLGQDRELSFRERSRRECRLATAKV